MLINWETMATKKPIISVIVERDIYNKLKEGAKKEKTSLSRYASKLIKEALYLKENVFKDEIYKNIDWLNEEWEDKFKYLFTTVLDTTPDPIWIKDINLKFVYVNQAFADLFGYKKEEMLGKGDAELLEEEVAKNCIYSDYLAINNEGPTHSVEAVVKDGKKLYFDVIKTPIKDKNGKVIAILGISRDITEIQEKCEIKSKEEKNSS